MLEVVLTLAGTLLKKAIEKRDKKGKSSKFAKKVFSQKVNDLMYKLWESHSIVLQEMEEDEDADDSNSDSSNS